MYIMSYRNDTLVIVMNTILIIIPFIIFIYIKIQKREEKKAEEKAKITALSLIRKEREALQNEVKKQKDEIFSLKVHVDKEREILEKEKKIQDKLFEEKTIGCPWVSEVYSNFVELKYIFLEKWLTAKRNPAYQASQIVADVKKDIKESEKERLRLLAIIKYYESSFPWLKEVRGVKDSDIGHFPPSVYNEINRERENIAYQYNEIQKEKEYLSTERHKLATFKADFSMQMEMKEKELQKQYAEIQSEKEYQQKLFEEKTIGFPWVAQKYAELKTLQLQAREKYLLDKKPAATKSAAIVKDCRLKLKKAEQSAYIYKGIIDYYETLFPWLTDFREAPDESIQLIQTSEPEEAQDPAQKLLSNAEWEKLSQTEKFQIALERYQKRKKTNWEIGRDFERYIGYIYEYKGFNVTFFGAIKGFEDMGRDIIAKKDDSTIIIQCKYWKKDKTIHEKHIFQLYGTCIVYGIENKETIPPTGIFITSCSLSDTAEKVAKALGIQTLTNITLKQYPCIKCNIGKGGEKIYHLPFDQQYDKIKMTKDNGCFYASTIDEAEHAGFRRAYRWHGNIS